MKQAVAPKIAYAIIVSSSSMTSTLQGGGVVGGVAPMSNVSTRGKADAKADTFGMSGFVARSALIPKCHER